MGKILRISLNLKFAANTLGCYGLRWFQRGRLKLEDDLKLSEKVQNKCTYRMAK